MIQTKNKPLKIQILRGDITELDVDCIVNAANKTLMGGGGVDGAIHNAAGIELREECKNLREIKYKEGLPKGEAVITKGYNLLAKFIIHTLGPIYTINKDQSALLKNCFINSLKLADENKCKSIAFPAISCGAYGYPKEKCAKIAKEAITNFKFNNIREIILCLYDNETKQIFEQEFAEQ